MSMQSKSAAVEILSRLESHKTLIYKVNRPKGDPIAYFRQGQEKVRVDRELVEHLMNVRLIAVDPASGICSGSKLAHIISADAS